MTHEVTARQELRTDGIEAYAYHVGGGDTVMLPRCFRVLTLWWVWLICLGWAAAVWLEKGPLAGLAVAFSLLTAFVLAREMNDMEQQYPGE